jgi:hypothetical protein
MHLMAHGGGYGSQGWRGRSQVTGLALPGREETEEPVSSLDPFRAAGPFT